MVGTIIFIAVAIFVGFVGGWVICMFSSKAKMRRLLADAESEAENLKKKRMLEVKEKFFNLKA